MTKPQLDLGEAGSDPEHDRESPFQPYVATPSLDLQLAQLPTGWEAATQLHKLKRVLPSSLRREVEERAVDAVLDRAREMLRHAARPMVSVAHGYPADGELDVDSTVEVPRPWRPEDIVIRRREPREADVVVILDMSLSMTGEKIALTALAAAILRIKLDRLAAVSFDTVAHLLVPMGSEVPVRELVRRVLGVPAQGYTNIEGGLLMGLEQLNRSSRRERAGIIMTDGIANVGWDPVKVAARYPLLHVVQVGAEEPQGVRTCERMARAGRGRRYRAPVWQELPHVVRQLIRECFEG